MELDVNPVDELVIERVVSTKNSYIKVNGTTITLSDLKNISKYLADIHMQFDNEKILNPENYLEIIDNFKYELTLEYKNEYSVLLSNFNKVRKEYLDLLEKAKVFNERRDYLEYSLKELDEMALEKGEDIKINEEISILKNFDKFYSIYQNLDSLIREDFTDKLYESQKLIEDISSFKEDYKEYSEKINDYYYEIDSIFDNIKKDFKRVDYDPNRLNELETRLNDIDTLKKKYKKSLDELVDYKEDIFTSWRFKSDIHIMPARAPMGVRKAPRLEPTTVAYTPRITSHWGNVRAMGQNSTLIGMLLMTFAERKERIP